MYNIDNFNVGDKLYRFQNSQWEFVTTVVERTRTNYSITNKHLTGALVVERSLLENEGLIALSKEPWK
jgi:hypothetical protein|tara:strand:- start:342 stop:545 length:204 start_codon:yes stop_codon:yes gene_type:complete